MAISNKEEHALVLEGSRKLRGRWRTVVRRVIRENKSREQWRQKKPPTFEQFLKHHELDDTYSRRFQKSTRQYWVDTYIRRVLALSDQASFRLAFGTQLAKYIDDKDVDVVEGISHSDARPNQSTLWFTTRRMPRS